MLFAFHLYLPGGQVGSITSKRRNTTWLLSFAKQKGFIWYLAMLKLKGGLTDSGERFLIFELNSETNTQLNSLTELKLN